MFYRTRIDSPSSRQLRSYRRTGRIYFTVTTILWLIYPACTKYFISCYAFAANFAAWFHLQGPAAGGAFWSLAVEEHFYLLWPLLVFLLPRKTLAALAIAIVIVTPAARALMASTGVDVETTIYVWSWFRFDTLALGALLAVWVRSDKSRRRHPLFMPGLLLGLALALTVCGIPIGILRTHSLASASLRYTQMGFLFAGLVSAALVLRGSWLTAPLRSRFARVSSDFSYCMYLIHMGIGYAVIRLSLSAGWNTEHFGPLGLVVRSALIILATFACAALSKRYLEDPMLRLKRYFPYSVSEPTAKSVPQCQ